MFARFKNLWIHVVLNSRACIFSLLIHLSLACTLFAASLIIEYVYTTLTRMRVTFLMTPSTYRDVRTYILHTSDWVRRYRIMIRKYRINWLLYIVHVCNLFDRLLSIKLCLPFFSQIHISSNYPRRQLRTPQKPFSHILFVQHPFLLSILLLYPQQAQNILHIWLKFVLRV